MYHDDIILGHRAALVRARDRWGVRANRTYRHQRHRDTATCTTGVSASALAGIQGGWCRQRRQCAKGPAFQQKSVLQCGFSKGIVDIYLSMSVQWQRPCSVPSRMAADTRLSAHCRQHLVRLRLMRTKRRETGVSGGPDGRSSSAFGCDGKEAPWALDAARPPGEAIECCIGAMGSC